MFKARHLCAILGIAIAVGTVVFMRSLVATNDHQALALAERLLEENPIPEDAQVCTMAVDYRPNGKVMQGPPMMACVAATKWHDTGWEMNPGDCVVTRAMFAQRRLPVPPVGTELTLIGRQSTYTLRIVGFLDWEKPLRGYPNCLVDAATVATIGEQWTPWTPKTAEELAPAFMSDAGRNMDRAKPLLLWAAALTALCLILNSLFLSVEARRKETAILRMVGMTRGGIVRCLFAEALLLSVVGFAVGTVAAVAGLFVYVACDPVTFPQGAAIAFRPIAVSAALLVPVVAIAVLVALKSALAVKPLEAASNRAPRKKHLGMLIAFAFGFGAFVAVEVWGSSLMSSFVPSPEWPDAIVSILPGGVSSFDIAKLQGKLKGVRRVHELQPLQVNFDPLEELKAGGSKDADVGKDLKDRKDGKDKKDGGDRNGVKGAAAGFAAGGRGMRGKQYRNALLLASDWLPDFKISAAQLSTPTSTLSEELAKGDNCLITSMMARARGLKLGDEVKLDCGRGLKIPLKVVGIVDLNWHLVTSRGLVRGLNRMPVNTDGPIFVSFDTLMACDGRPQEMVKMTHVWLDYEPEFLAAHGAFEAGRIVEREIVEALGGAFTTDDEGEVHGNTVRLHSRDEIADGTFAHGDDIVGAMARVPFVFIAVISLGFVAMLVASADARRREFAVLRAVGATKAQLAAVLVKEALKVAVWGIVFGFAGGALAGWLFTAGTRAAMANWGLPPAFAVPVFPILRGMFGAVVFTLVFAVPSALALVSRASRRD